MAQDVFVAAVIHRPAGCKPCSWSAAASCVGLDELGQLRAAAQGAEHSKGGAAGWFTSVFGLVFTLARFQHVAGLPRQLLAAANTARVAQQVIALTV
jgi:hypothetical protein